MIVSLGTLTKCHKSRRSLVVIGLFVVVIKMFCVCIGLFWWSGQVTSSLWSNVSRATSPSDSEAQSALWKFFLLQKLGLSESVSDKVTYRNVLGQLKSNDEENSPGVTSLVVMDNVSRGQRMSWTMSAGLVLGIRSRCDDTWSPTQHEAGNWNSKFCWSNVLRMIWYPNITSPMH